MKKPEIKLKFSQWSLLLVGLLVGTTWATFSRRPVLESNYTRLPSTVVATGEPNTTKDSLSRNRRFIDTLNYSISYKSNFNELLRYYAYTGAKTQMSHIVQAYQRLQNEAHVKTVQQLQNEAPAGLVISQPLNKVAPNKTPTNADATVSCRISNAQDSQVRDYNLLVAFGESGAMGCDDISGHYVAPNKYDLLKKLRQYRAEISKNSLLTETQVKSYLQELNCFFKSAEKELTKILSPFLKTIPVKEIKIYRFPDRSFDQAFIFILEDNQPFLYPISEDSINSLFSKVGRESEQAKIQVYVNTLWDVHSSFDKYSMSPNSPESVNQLTELLDMCIGRLTPYGENNQPVTLPPAVYKKTFSPIQWSHGSLRVYIKDMDIIKQRTFGLASEGVVGYNLSNGKLFAGVGRSLFYPLNDSTMGFVLGTSIGIEYQSERFRMHEGLCAEVFIGIGLGV